MILARKHTAAASAIAMAAVLLLSTTTITQTYAIPFGRFGVVQGLSTRSKQSTSNGDKMPRVNDHSDVVNLRLLKDVMRRCDSRKVVLGGLAVAGMMEPMRRAVYFWVRAGPIVAHYKWTQWWLETSHAPKAKRDVVYNSLHDRYCQPTYQIILNLRGLYVKIGQVLSSRPDFVPRQYIDLFSLAQDSIPPWSFSKVRSIIDQSLRQHQGLEFDDVFESMDEAAIGTAAIGQCHKAVLRKDINFVTGDVAVKVMEPHAEARFQHDFKVFRWLCRLAMPGWTPLLNEMERQLMSEFDYRAEASNLQDVRENLQQSPYKNLACIPQPFDELCSPHLLVMEMLDGKKLSDSFEDKLADAIGGDRQSARAFIDQKRQELFSDEKPNPETWNTKNRIDVSELMAGASVSSRVRTTRKLLSLQRHIRNRLDLLVNIHGHQILIDGVFNGDCHPGNVLELSNGKLGLIDYGQTKRLDEDRRLQVAKAVSVLGQNDIDQDEATAVLQEMGFQTKHSKPEVMVRYGKLFFDSDSGMKDFGCATPQLYLMKLMSMDPLEKVPDAAVMVARTSFLFRGLGSVVDEQLQTSKKWRKHAAKALATASAT